MAEGGKCNNNVANYYRTIFHNKGVRSAGGCNIFHSCMGFLLKWNLICTTAEWETLEALAVIDRDKCGSAWLYIHRVRLSKLLDCSHHTTCWLHHLRPEMQMNALWQTRYPVNETFWRPQKLL